MNAPATKRATKRPKQRTFDWRTYEARKNSWLLAHPYATHAAYQRAMQKIVRGLWL